VYFLFCDVAGDEVAGAPFQEAVDFFEISGFQLLLQHSLECEVLLQFHSWVLRGRNRGVDSPKAEIDRHGTYLGTITTLYTFRNSS
jgi:hypothetical protein